MSDTTYQNGFGALRAGNTTETLAPTSALPSGADLDAIAAEQEAAVLTAGAPDVSSTPTPADAPAVTEDEDPLDDENTFDVSRAEFSEIQDALLRIEARFLKFNQKSIQKI